MTRPGPPEPADPATLVGLLAEPDRLRAFAAVALGARTVDETAERAGIGVREATVALERLAGAGAVVDTGDGLAVATHRFKEAARAAAEAKRAEDRKHDDFGGLPDDAATVLRNFVHRGRLVRIPAHKTKRLVVLDWLAGRFEPGATYPEARVNLMLGMVHADVAALRRYLVDEGFLERRDGFYWRAGGTFETEEP